MNAASLSSPERHPPSPFSTLFNLTDPAEHFMAGWISRVHTEPPRLYLAIALKRSTQINAGKTERLIYEVARVRGKTPHYTVITWNIDEISMRWRDFARRREAMAIYGELSGGYS